MSSVTVEELDQLIKLLAEKETAKEVQAESMKLLNKEIMELEAKITNYLKDLKREDYDSPFGKVKIMQKWSVNLPETDQDKREFFSWLREKGIFDRYATVNSRSLQSLFRAEWDEAKRQGEGLTFSLPGIRPAKLFETTEFKIKK